MSISNIQASQRNSLNNRETKPLYFFSELLKKSKHLNKLLLYIILRFAISQGLSKCFVEEEKYNMYRRMDGWIGNGNESRF